jgi:hypothetical protein
VFFPRESLILECYTLKCATLKLFAGGLSARLVETGKARTINGLMASSRLAFVQVRVNQRKERVRRLPRSCCYGSAFSAGSMSMPSQRTPRCKNFFSAIMLLVVIGEGTLLVMAVLAVLGVI